MKISLKIIHQARIAMTVTGSLLLLLASQAQGSRWSDGIRPVQSCDIDGCQVVRGIVKLPALIDRPGRYVLPNSLHYSGEWSAIAVTAKNVEIDMRGNALHGPYTGCGQGEAIPYGARSFGISTGNQGVIVKNGLISGFGQGIDTSGWSDVRGEKVVQITGMRIVNVLEAGLRVSGDSFLVENNLVANVGGNCIDGAIGIGIYPTGRSNKVVRNAIYNITDNPNNPHGEYSFGITVSGLGVVRMTGNKVYNVNNYGIAIEGVKAFMRETNIANYRGHGDAGLRVGWRRISTIHYAGTDISGYVDGVSVGRRSRLIDGGNNTVH